MHKLLSAEFVRLFKSFIFKLGLAFSAGLAGFVVLVRWLDVKKNADIYAKLDVTYHNADGLIFTGGFYLIFAVAVFIAIFVGTEYSDGTLRNKLTAGHTRSSIYLSKLIVCAAADLIMHLLYILIVLALGNLLLDGTSMKAKELLLFSSAGATAMLALTALLLLLSMAVQNKAAGSVICLLTTLIMMFAALTILQRLNAPEYYDAYTYIDENTGEAVSVPQEKNTRYLSGTKREVYEFLNNFIPVSQLYQIVMNIPDNLSLIAIYDCVIILVTTGAGIFIFKKKDLK